MHSKIFRSENGLENFLSPPAGFFASKSPFISFKKRNNSPLFLILFVCFLAAIQSAAQVLRHQLEDEVNVESTSINPPGIVYLTLIFNMVFSLRSTTAD